MSLVFYRTDVASVDDELSEIVRNKEQKSGEDNSVMDILKGLVSKPAIRNLVTLSYSIVNLSYEQNSLLW